MTKRSKFRNSVIAFFSAMVIVTIANYLFLSGLNDWTLIVVDVVISLIVQIAIGFLLSDLQHRRSLQNPMIREAQHMARKTGKAVTGIRKPDGTWTVIG